MLFFGDVFYSLVATIILAFITTTRVNGAPFAAMVGVAARGIKVSGRKRKHDLSAQAGVAISDLPFDVTVSLFEKHLPDPADLALLRAVSKGMRDAVDATGRKVKEFKEYGAAWRGYLSTLLSLIHI